MMNKFMNKLQNLETIQALIPITYTDLHIRHGSYFAE